MKALRAGFPPAGPFGRAALWAEIGIGSIVVGFTPARFLGIMTWFLIFDKLVTTFWTAILPPITTTFTIVFGSLRFGQPA